MPSVENCPVFDSDAPMTIGPVGLDSVVGPIPAELPTLVQPATASIPTIAMTNAFLEHQEAAGFTPSRSFPTTAGPPPARRIPASQCGYTDRTPHLSDESGKPHPFRARPASAQARSRKRPRLAGPSTQRIPAPCTSYRPEPAR